VFSHCGPWLSALRATGGGGGAGIENGGLWGGFSSRERVVKASTDLSLIGE